MLVIHFKNASNITDAQIGDINGDGTADILLNNFSNNSTNNLQVYISNGNGYDNVNLGSGLYNAKGRVVDLNNDGQAEVTLIGVSSTTTSGVPKFYTYEYDKSSKGFKDKKDLSSQIASLKYASFDLGDVDNDLDIDFLISGFDESNGLESYLYENTTTIGEDYQLTETNNNLVAIRDGTVDFIDFDSDGDLDAVFSGTGLQGDVFEIYRNDLSEGKKNWPRINVGLDGIRNGKIDLGDFNGDGYIDLLYSGLEEGSGKVTKLAEYRPSELKYVYSNFDVSDILDAEVEFGDIDGDGDLDFALSGESKSNPGSYIFKTYLNSRNESAAVLAGSSANTSFCCK